MSWKETDSGTLSQNSREGEESEGIRNRGSYVFCEYARLSERNLHYASICWKSMSKSDFKAQFAKQMIGETARIGIKFWMSNKISFR